MKNTLTIINKPKGEEMISIYQTWNIQDLISESININAEIHARIKSLVDVESDLLTYEPIMNAEKYKENMEEIIDLVRKGSK